jgi:uncharacterized protein (DUF1499 family)
MAPVVTSQTEGRTGARVGAALAWAGLGVAVTCGIALLIAGLGYRMGWWRLGPGFATVRWAVTVDLAAIVIAVAAAILAFRYRVRGAFAAALLGLGVSLAVAGPPLYLWWQAQDLPHIHDISTDTDNPPRYVAVMPLRKDARNPTDYRAETAAQQKKGYPDIAPAMLAEPPAQALQRANRAARAMGWEIVAVVPDDLRIEATDTTLLFGFKDDVVIRVTASGSGSRVDVRSLSRIGGSDLGTNAKRVRAFLRQLEAAKIGG